VIFRWNNILWGYTAFSRSNKKALWSEITQVCISLPTRNWARPLHDPKSAESPTGVSTLFRSSWSSSTDLLLLSLGVLEALLKMKRIIKFPSFRPKIMFKIGHWYASKDWIQYKIRLQSTSRSLLPSTVRRMRCRVVVSEAQSSYSNLFKGLRFTNVSKRSTLQEVAPSLRWSLIFCKQYHSWWLSILILNILSFPLQRVEHCR